MLEADMLDETLYEVCVLSDKNGRFPNAKMLQTAGHQGPAWLPETCLILGIKHSQNSQDESAFGAQTHIFTFAQNKTTGMPQLN